MKHLRIIFLLAAALFVGTSQAQDEDAEYRLEMGAAAGLGFSLDDTNSKFYGGSSFAGGLLTRFLINRRMAVKLGLSYAKTSGTTEGVANFYPDSPDAVSTERLRYSFDGGIYDLSALYELHFLPYGYEKGYQGYSRIVPYLQAGIGVTYATPGKAFAPNIPVGVGLKYKAGRRLNIGLEWRMHFTTSDKLDGLEAPLGIKSSGFRNKDHYSFTVLTLTYDLAPKCPNCNKD